MVMSISRCFGAAHQTREAGQSDFCFKRKITLAPLFLIGFALSFSGHVIAQTPRETATELVPPPPPGYDDTREAGDKGHQAEQDLLDPERAFDSKTGQNLHWDRKDKTWKDSKTGKALGFQGARSKKACPPPPTTATTPQPPPNPPPPIPPKHRTVCAECQGIQDRIDANSDALDAANSDYDDAVNQVRDAQARLGSDQGQLEAVKANPKDFDISAAKVQAKIDADNADIAAGKAKADKASAEKARLENELRELGAKLDKCLKKKCGHASANRELKNSLFNIGIDSALGKHHKKDKRDDEDKQNDKEQHDDTPPNDDEPWH